MSYSSSLSFPRSLPRTPASSPQSPAKKKHQQQQPTTSIRSLMIGVEEISAIAHNKVLVAATVASAIGQLSKPLTSAIGGKGVDVKAAVRSGGMPSTHSAGVVAVATSLGLERGFADSIFGMSVVFAAIVMYDAQGVRREVGYHAAILNKILNLQEKSALDQEVEDLVESKSGKSSVNLDENLAPILSRSEKANSYSSNQEPYAFRGSRITSKLGSMRRLTINGIEPSEMIYSNNCPLNESVGHTEIQVIVGAILGFVVSLALDTIM